MSLNEKHYQTTSTMATDIKQSKNKNQKKKKQKIIKRPTHYRSIIRIIVWSKQHQSDNGNDDDCSNNYTVNSILSIQVITYGPYIMRVSIMLRPLMQFVFFFFFSSHFVFSNKKPEEDFPSFCISAVHRKLGVRWDTSSGIKRLSCKEINLEDIQHSNVMPQTVRFIIYAL